MAQFICIVCPKGCHLNVDEKNDYAVTGNGCPRGAEYGKKEAVHPERVLTSTVRICGGVHRRCPVKTDRPIPKNMLFSAMRQLERIELSSPVRCGEIVSSCFMGTDANLVVTKSM